LHALRERTQPDEEVAWESGVTVNQIYGREGGKGGKKIGKK